MNGDSKSPARTSGQTKTSQTKYSTTKLKEQSSLTNSSLGHSRTSVNSSAKFSTTSKTGLESNTNIRSRVGVDQKKNEQFVIVRDANGQDATPISLAFTKSGRVDTLGNQEASTRDTVSDLLNNLESVGSQFNMIEVQSIRKSSAFGDSAQVLSQQGESINDEVSNAGSSESGRDNENLDDLALPGINMQSKPIEIDPLKYSSIRLSETNTFNLLEIISTVVSSESIDETAIVKQQNAKYKELKSIIQNNDNYVSRAMQTINNPLKNKEVQASSQKSVNQASMTNEWSIYDAYCDLDKRPASPEVERKEIDLEAKIKVMESKGTINADESIMISSNNSSMVSHLDEARASITSISHKTAAQTVKTQKDDIAMLDPASVLTRLSLVERAIVGNSYEKKVIMFRNVADDGMIEKKRIELLVQSKEETEHEAALKSQTPPKDDYATNTLPTLQLLWNYKCELTRGRSVSCVSLNKQNEDICAVAYGESRFLHGASPGLILCWSAKNPEWPDRIYNSDSPCTSIAFSKLNPGLLAASYFDGRIVIYNTKLNQSNVLVECDSISKHRDPVWELQWVEKERVVGDDQSKCEILVSVSTDGRVTQWMIRKGLEHTDLMVLKRLTKQKKQGNNNTTVNNNSFISRQTGGLCFDFNSKDSNIYLVGTEDGQIHKCSSTYNEQYLSTYSNHTGPVNKIKWSPFNSNLFLSCSSDWTVRLWNQDSEEEIFKFQNGKDTINDIAWSPHCSTFFATVSSAGKLEIWDLTFSALDPAINHTVLDRQFTTVLFGSQSPTVIAGDDNGVVYLLKLCKNIEAEDDPTSNGIMSPYGSGQFVDEHTYQWKQEQIQALNNVIYSKISNQLSVAPPAL